MNNLQKALPDLRYTVQKEFCGQSSAQYVARFCGQWIGFAETQEAAIIAAHSHKEAQQ